MKKFIAITFICILQFGCASTGIVGRSSEVQSEYDLFDDETTYETPELKIIRPGFWDEILNITNHRVKFSAYFQCAGKSKCTPDNVVLSFSSQSKNWQYLYLRDLKMIIDGERFDFGELERVSLVSYPTVLETLFYIMDLDTYLKFSEAQNVEILLGSDEVSLEYEDLEIFRNLSNTISNKTS